MTRTQGNHLRLIPRLDVKLPNLVKGVRLEGFRVVGNPVNFAAKYSVEGADEIVYQDIVASLYQRNSALSLVESTAKTTFVPLSVGGGIRNLGDIRNALLHGADRVIINTAAVERPKLISDAAEVFGSQCVIVAVEAVSVSDRKWEPLINCGRDRTGLDLEDWIRKLEDLGAGEVFVTSVDREGTRKGLDLAMLDKARSSCDLPIIAHGGVWTADDVAAGWNVGASGVAIASALHFGNFSLEQLKREISAAGVPVRTDA